MKAINRLRVATRRITNANPLAIATPYKADVKNTVYVGNHAHIKPAVILIECIEEGARFLKS